MVRPGASLVKRASVLGMVLALACGCAEDLPKTVLIDDRFTPEEEQMIVEMIDEWNRVGREHLDMDSIIIYQGRFRDPDGFDPYDLDDGRSVIYLGEDDQYYKYLDGTDGLTLLGYGTTADMLLFTFTFDDQREFRHVALHEMGHFLGLAHVPDDVDAVMYHVHSADPPIRLTRTDVQAFCLVYGCVRQP